MLAHSLSFYLQVFEQALVRLVHENAAIDITHAMEEYACSDYKCFILDTAATACDITGAVVAFVPGNTTKKILV